MKKILAILLILCLLPAWALTEKAWILCNPKSYVTCRRSPIKGAMLLGRYDCGDPVETTGKEKNGFVQVETCFEMGLGWVYAGYIVYDEPVEVNEKRVITSNARVLARRWVNGPVKKRLKNMTEIFVYWESPTWAYTSKGYIKTELTGDYDP